jgi:outer membrane protein assembly factor BamB
MSTGEVLSSPVAAGNAVYFGSTDGNVYAVGN